MDDAIDALAAGDSSGEENDLDEFEYWRKYEPRWTLDQFKKEGNAICYWTILSPKYPNLAQFAINILTIPASSCDCEQVFSEVGDLMEPKRHHMGSELLAAIQCIRTWTKASFHLPSETLAEKLAAKLTNEELEIKYGLCGWEPSM